MTKVVRKNVTKNMMKSVWKVAMKSDFPYVLPSRFTFMYYLVQASNFARTWLEQLDEAVARTRAFHAAAELGSGIGSKECSPSHGKIVLNCSVHRLGLHLKLLFEEDFSPGTSKMELCKAITKFFSTVNQPDISFRSLKNAMDAPREQALEMFMEKWVGYLDKATDMKVMN